MMHIVLGTGMLCIFFLQLIGGSFFSSFIVAKALKKIHGVSWDASLDPLFGFGFFAVLLSYAGFLGAGKFQIVVSTAGLLCALYGCRILYRFRSKGMFRRMFSQWRVWIVPAAVVGIVAVGKLWHFPFSTGGGDEPRSFLLTSGIANNGLRPAFPMDFSLPLVYPYYLFEISGFLYATFGGLQFPSTAITATSLYAIALSYYSLFVVCRRIFPDNPDEKFILASLFLAAPDLRYVLFAAFERYPDWKFGLPLTHMPDYLHSGYHYLWGCMISLIGMNALHRFLGTKDRNEWMVFLLCILLGFGFMAIPSLWFITGATLLIGGYAARAPLKTVRLLLREMKVVLVPLAFIVTPQIVNLLPRTSVTFSLSGPHVWFPRTAILFSGTGTILSHLKGFVFGPMSLFWSIGFFLLIAFAVGIVLFAAWFVKGRLHSEWNALMPFCAVAAAGFLILTFTTSVSGDWFGRGFLAVTTSMTLVAAKIFSSLLAKKRFAITHILCGLLLTAQIACAVLENIAYRAQHVSDSAMAVQNTTPLGTVLYDASGRSDLYEAFMAGRSAIFPPQRGYQAYLIRSDILQRYFGIDIKENFTPCITTSYGSNTPLNAFMPLVNGEFELETRCPQTP